MAGIGIPELVPKENIGLLMIVFPGHRSNTNVLRAIYEDKFLIYVGINHCSKKTSVKAWYSSMSTGVPAHCTEYAPASSLD